MPNIKSAKKRVQVAAVRQARNKAAKTALKTVLKKADADTNEQSVKAAVKAVDKAAAMAKIQKPAAAINKSPNKNTLNSAA